MAEYKHQQQDLRAGLQHLANRQQEDSAHPVQVLGQFPQHLQALVAIQDLERQRLGHLTQAQVGGQPQ